MEWVYLSPHLDDVALSCGGLVWQQAHSRRHVSVLTICAGDPPPGEFSEFVLSLHTRWKTSSHAITQRRQEDIESCQLLGAAAHHLSIPDCIYRRGGEQNLPLYPTEESIFGPPHPVETGLLEELAATLASIISDGARVVSPLAIGNHVDHHLTRQAAEKLGLRLWYYADFPYVLKNSQNLEQLEREGWEWQLFPLLEQGVQIWLEAIAAHASQISTFWPDLESMRSEMRAYYRNEHGVRLWRPANSRL
ncbi:MAG TPA: PIG-L family deacetylase [Anaerolineales bacterium]|nr:PIG-L family deacetylase [Anaerolineales bacterium]